MYHNTENMGLIAVLLTVSVLVGLAHLEDEVFQIATPLVTLSPNTQSVPFAHNKRRGAPVMATGVSVLFPMGFQAVPFHRATFDAVTPPILEKLPETYILVPSVITLSPAADDEVMVPLPRGFH